MILDDHQVAGIQVTPDATCSVRGEINLRAKLLHYSHGKSGKLRSMSFIHVKATGQRNDSFSAKLPEHYCAGVTHYCRLGKSRDVTERNANLILDFVRKSAEPRSEHNCNARCESLRTRANRICSFLRFSCVAYVHAAPSCSRDISCDTSFKSFTLSSHGRNA